MGKAASLPENITDSCLVPSPATATMGSDAPMSLIEKLECIESFMVLLTEESLTKDTALLERRGDSSFSTTTSDPVVSWFCSSNMEPPTSILEVSHPLAMLLTSEVENLLPNSEESFTSECPITSGLAIKEELLTLEFSSSTVPTTMVDTTPNQTKSGNVSSTTKGCTQVVPLPKRTSPVGASGPTVTPHKPKAKAWGVFILHSALEVPLEVKILAKGKKARTTSTPQSLVVWYN